MACADTLNGPWKIIKGGVQQLAATACHDHIASPDVHVIDDMKTIGMYFHGVKNNGQRSLLATSPNGLHFHALS